MQYPPQCELAAYWSSVWFYHISSYVYGFIRQTETNPCLKDINVKCCAITVRSDLLLKADGNRKHPRKECTLVCRLEQTFKALRYERLGCSYYLTAGFDLFTLD